MSFPRILIVLLATVAVGVGLAACGGDDNSPSTTAAPTSKAASATTKPAGSSSPAAAATSPAASGAAGDVVKVTAKDFEFDPAAVEAPANKQVTFQLTNSGSATHTLTIYQDDAYTKPVTGASVQASSGKQGEFTVTFPNAGDFYFRCEIHPSRMHGEIKVS
jgi:plastocyanin